MTAPASQPPAFNPAESAALLDCARREVGSAVDGSTTPAELPPILAATPVAGVFVTLRHHDELRACIGNWHPDQPVPLGPALRHAARAAATSDHRFPAIPAAELPHLTVELSILHSPNQVTGGPAGRLAAVATGRHGLVLEDHRHRGMLLPQVATEHAWDARTFLEHTARKAGLPAGAWRRPNTNLTTFEAFLLTAPPL